MPELDNAESEPVAADPVVSSEAKTLLVFRVGAFWFAVAADGVEEILDATELVSIPQAPSHIPGMVNLRGAALPLLDMGLFLELPVQEKTGEGDLHDLGRGRTVVVKAQQMLVGIMCDQLRGILSVDSVDLRDPCVIKEGRVHEFAVAEWQGPDGLTSMVDVDSLLEAARVR